MTFAIGEIIVYIVLAALLGLTLGFVLWYRKLATADADVNAMHDVLARQTARLDQIETEREKVASEFARLTTKAERNAAEVETLRSRVSELTPLADRVPDLRDRIDDLTEERDRLATIEVLGAPSAGDRRESVPSYVGFEPLESLRENPDDLQRISGIGPHLEGLLNSNDIYTFRQIALLSDEGLRELDEQLGFKGRIKRDEWVSQADDLHREKFDSDPGAGA